MPDMVNDVLSKRVDETEKPKPRPQGTYQGQIFSLPQVIKRMAQGEERQLLNVKIKLIAARDDVDEQDLSAQPDIHTWPTLNYDFWFDTPEGEYNLKRFIENGLGLETSGKTYGELLPEMVSKQALFTVQNRPYTNRTTGENEISTDIRGYAPL